MLVNIDIFKTLWSKVNVTASMTRSFSYALILKIQGTGSLAIKTIYHKSSIEFGERHNVQTYHGHENFPQHSSREENERPRNAEDDCMDEFEVDSHADDLRVTAWVGGYARGRIRATRVSHRANELHFKPIIWSINK